MKTIWVNKTKSFKKAEKFDRKYYLAMTPEERLEIIQLLREGYLPWGPLGRTGKTRKNESGKRLQRVISFIQQT